MGGGARGLATDTFRGDEAGTVMGVCRGVRVADAEAGNQGENPAGFPARDQPGLQS